MSKACDYGMMQCADCKKWIRKNQPRHRRCEECAKAHGKALALARRQILHTPEWKARRREMRRKNPLPLKPRFCKQCGEEYLPAHFNSKYCSDKCEIAMKSARMKRMRKWKGVGPRPCKQCGQKFEPSRGNNEYCSDECRARVHRAAWQVYLETGASASGKLKKNYGITLKQRNEILDKQGGYCVICGHLLADKFYERPLADEARKPFVDHDHTTLNIRGIICLQCNVAIGMLNDNPDTCYRVGEYLAKYEKKEKE